MFAYGVKLTSSEPTNFITSAKVGLHHPGVVVQIGVEGLPSAVPALILGAWVRLVGLWA